MSEHKVKINWKRSSEDFTLKTYNRDHLWDFDGGETVKASAAPNYGGDAEMVDPEQAFTAAVSACHMLVFLAMAAQKGLTVNGYTDEAVGELGKNDEGRQAITRVTLRPEIEFEDDPDRDTLEELHEKAHKDCFIANSVKCDIEVDF